MKNKAGAIIRVSTTRQLEGTSPEKQIERIRGLADAQGYDIAQKHIWQLAESGGSRERVGFAEALKAGTKGEISRIYVFNIDRLGRDLLEMLLFLRQLEDMGIDCWGAEKSQQRPRQIIGEGHAGISPASGIPDCARPSQLVR